MGNLNCLGLDLYLLACRVKTLEDRARKLDPPLTIKEERELAFGRVLLNLDQEIKRLKDDMALARLGM